MTEEWREIPCFHKYQVSTWGRVYSDKSDRILSPHCGMNGYLTVCLSRGRCYPFTVHVLMALAFIGPHKAGYQVCHGNGIPWDNRLSNLSYGTISENNLARRQSGQGFVIFSIELRREIAAASKMGEMSEGQALWFLTQVGAYPLSASQPEPQPATD